MDLRQLPVEPPLDQFKAFADHPGGCYTCRWFGERVDVAVWCAHPGGQHLRSQGDRGCAFWQRQPGSDDE